MIITGVTRVIKRILLGRQNINKSSTHDKSIENNKSNKKNINN